MEVQDYEHVDYHVACLAQHVDEHVEEADQEALCYHVERHWGTVVAVYVDQAGQQKQPVQVHKQTTQEDEQSVQEDKHLAHMDGLLAQVGKQSGRADIKQPAWVEELQVQTEIAISIENNEFLHGPCLIVWKLSHSYEHKFHVEGREVFSLTQGPPFERTTFGCLLLFRPRLLAVEQAVASDKFLVTCGSMKCRE